MLKKILSLVMAFILYSTLFFTTVYATASSIQSISYEKYDCLTQEENTYSTEDWQIVTETPGYAGDGFIESEINPYQVIGDCNLGKIEYTTATRALRAASQIIITFPNNTTVYGSAIMVGPSTALTAAHCIYNSAWGGFAKTVTLIPARNLSTKPYGEAKASYISIPSAYKTNPKVGYDIAVLNLSSAIGNKSGYLSCKAFSTSVLTDPYQCGIEIDGYPESGHVNLSGRKTKLGEMWGMGGVCTYASGKVMRYTIDTFPGMSGAGIVAQSYYIAGVHDGYPTNNQTYNHGTRIDSEYLTWINGLLK